MPETDQLAVLAFEAWRHFLRRFTYRPGWRFQVIAPERWTWPAELALAIDAKVIDAYHPERCVTVTHMARIDPMAADDTSIQLQLYRVLWTVEQHELGEFFVVAGRRPFDPHHTPASAPPTTLESPPAFICPRCGAQSWHPEDASNGYCGRCHDYTALPRPV